MRKNKFIKSTLILILGSIIVKIMGMIIKIIYTRNIGDIGIGLYTIIMPTYSLIVSISGFGMPITISKMISEGKIRSKSILSQGLYILFLVNILTMFIIIVLSKFISTTLLNEPSVQVLLIASTLSMPNMAIACILKGYFYGKQRMLPNTISNIIEQAIRLIFVIFLLPKIVKISVLYGVLSFLLINIITEGASILTFLMLLPKNTIIKLNDIKYDKTISSSLMSLSLPIISGRIIGNIGYFFEPIILSNTLKFVGYNSSFFIREYGIYNGYAISTLMFPSFIITSLCTALIPEIAKYYANNNIRVVKLRIKQALVISFIFGIITTLFININSTFILKTLYNTDLGGDYIKILSYFFFLYYLEAPLSTILQAIGLAKYSMKITTLGVILKLVCMFIFSMFKIGLYGLIISEAINIIYVVYSQLKKIKKVLNKYS